MKGKKTTGDILKESFSFYRANYLKLFITALIVYGTVSIYGYATNALSDTTGLMKYDPKHASTVVALSSIILSILISQVFGILSMMFSYNANDTALHFSIGGKPSVKVIASHFAQRWSRYLGLAAWTTLWVTLWGLLFFIPALIKNYSYKLAPYLIIQYPDMTVREALQKSKELTRGSKGRLFALDLFLLLPLLVLYIVLNFIFHLKTQTVSGFLIYNGIMFVPSLLYIQPLSYMAFATAYLDIKQPAVKKGILPKK